jgi:hypothetical protein
MKAVVGGGTQRKIAIGIAVARMRNEIAAITTRINP